MMEKIFGIFVFGLILMVISPILGAFFGALAGWCVSLVWEVEILDFMRRVGVDTDGLTLWQTGAAMGFLGGFLKTSVYQKEK
jgi:hypothetical protein